MRRKINHLFYPQALSRTIGSRSPHPASSRCLANAQRRSCGECKREPSNQCWTLISFAGLFYTPGTWRTGDQLFFLSRRDEPSVVAMVYPFTGDHKQKYYWGHKEVLIPVYKKMSDAINKHKEVDVLVSFASLRSAYDSTLEVLDYPQIRTIAIIAEGIPENMTRKLNKLATQRKVNIIGPATVGGVKPGCFKIGNTGGMLDNILHSKLYRPGSVAYVSRSGGMSNELNNIISKATDGVFEGVAIGGDRYPGTTFMDHIMRYQNDPEAKMIVLLGEVGGTEEYEVCEALKDGTLTKPLVAWCIGTCAGKLKPYKCLIYD